ncbi:hypothetical protein 20Aug401_00025 [Pseudomonas phage 20Aug401]|uniref:Uncharacterized protein n=1 Tax=Pseudomonas phage 20Aug401 TaxID=3028482 RepID=A0AAF0FDA8_9CAUD|nr:hypothetical protein 20Aug401_00025 [Pseudomonas phage 20Aug401]
MTRQGRVDNMAATKGSDSFLAVEVRSFTSGTWTGAVG